MNISKWLQQDEDSSSTSPSDAKRICQFITYVIHDLLPAHAKSLAAGQRTDIALIPMYCIYGNVISLVPIVPVAV